MDHSLCRFLIQSHLSLALCNWIDKQALNFFSVWILSNWLSVLREDGSREWTTELCSWLREFFFSELLSQPSFIFSSLPLIHSLLSLISAKLSQDLVHPQRCTSFRNVADLPFLCLFWKLKVVSWLYSCFSCLTYKYSLWNCNMIHTLAYCTT